MVTIDSPSVYCMHLGQDKKILGKQGDGDAVVGSPKAVTLTPNQPIALIRQGKKRRGKKREEGLLREQLCDSAIHASCDMTTLGPTCKNMILILDFPP